MENGSELLNQFISLLPNLENVIILLISSVVLLGVRNFAFSQVQKKLVKEKLIPSSFSLAKHFYPFGMFFVIFLLIAVSVPMFQIPIKVNYRIMQFVQIGLILSGGVVIIRIIKLLKVLAVRRIQSFVADTSLKPKRLRTQIEYFERIFVVVIYFLMALAILLVFPASRKFGGTLMASAGLAGTIIGFAAQRSIANVIAGFQIAFTQPIRIGDTVVIEGHFGTIKEITLTYITLQIWDGRAFIIPISYLLSHPFENWSKTTEPVFGKIYLQVDATADIDALRELLQKILNYSEFWDNHVGSLQVMNIHKDHVELRILVTAKELDLLYDLMYEVKEKFLIYFQKNSPHSICHFRVVSPKGHREEDALNLL